MNQSKRCTVCGLTQPLMEFSKRTDKPGHHARCKKCVRAYAKSRYSRIGHDADRSRRYYLANRDRILASSAAYARENPDKRKALKQRRRAHWTGRLGISADEISARFAMFGDCCWMCGADWESIDHVKPISRGGSHILANLRPACTSCNSAKHNKWFGPRELHRFKRTPTT